MKKTKIIHRFLNEPELVKIADIFEGLLVPTTILQFVLGWTINPTFLISGTLSTLLFITFYKLRRPIQRTNEKEGRVNNQ